MLFLRKCCVYLCLLNLFFFASYVHPMRGQSRKLGAPQAAITKKDWLKSRKRIMPSVGPAIPLAMALARSKLASPYSVSHAACSVRVGRCQKVIQCGKLTLLAGLVATTAVIGYATYTLVGVGQELVPAVQDLAGVAKGLVGLGQQGMALAQSVIGEIKGMVPALQVLVNTTRDTCQNAASICLKLQQNCHLP